MFQFYKIGMFCLISWSAINAAEAARSSATQDGPPSHATVMLSLFPWRGNLIYPDSASASNPTYDVRQLIPGCYRTTLRGTVGYMLVIPNPSGVNNAMILAPEFIVNSFVVSANFRRMYNIVRNR